MAKLLVLPAQFGQLLIKKDIQLADTALLLRTVARQVSKPLK